VGITSSRRRWGNRVPGIAKTAAMGGAEDEVGGKGLGIRKARLPHGKCSMG